MMNTMNGYPGRRSLPNMQGHDSFGFPATNQYDVARFQQGPPMASQNFNLNGRSSFANQIPSPHSRSQVAKPYQQLPRRGATTGPLQLMTAAPAKDARSNAEIIAEYLEAYPDATKAELVYLLKSVEEDGTAEEMVAAQQQHNMYQQQRPPPAQQQYQQPSTAPGAPFRHPAAAGKPVGSRPKPPPSMYHPPPPPVYGRPPTNQRPQPPTMYHPPPAGRPAPRRLPPPASKPQQQQQPAPALQYLMNNLASVVGELVKDTQKPPPPQQRFARPAPPPPNNYRNQAGILGEAPPYMPAQPSRPIMRPRYQGPRGLFNATQRRHSTDGSFNDSLDRQSSFDQRRVHSNQGQKPVLFTRVVDPNKKPPLNKQARKRSVLDRLGASAADGKRQKTETSVLARVGGHKVDTSVLSKAGSAKSILDRVGLGKTSESVLSRVGSQSKKDSSILGRVGNSGGASKDSSVLTRVGMQQSVAPTKKQPSVTIKPTNQKQQKAAKAKQNSKKQATKTAAVGVVTGATKTAAAEPVFTIDLTGTDDFTEERVLSEQQRADLFGKTFRTQYDERVDTFDGMIKLVGLNEQQKEQLPALTEIIRDEASKLLNFEYPFRSHTRRKVEQASSLVYSKYMKKMSDSGLDKTFTRSEIISVMDDVITNDATIKNSQEAVLEHIERIGKDWSEITYEIFVVYQDFVMTSCTESSDVEGELRSLCDKIDVFFPQFAGNAPEMIAMWKWKVKSETVLKAIETVHKTAIPSSKYPPKIEGDSLSEEDSRKLSNWLSNIFAESPKKTTDPANRSVLVAMTKTMKKETIIDRILDWWVIGYYKYNFEKQNGAVEVIDIDTDTNNDEEVAVTAAGNGKDEEDTVIDIPITVDDDDTTDDVIDPPMSPTLTQKPKKTALQQQKQNGDDEEEEAVLIEDDADVEEILI